MFSLIYYLFGVLPIDEAASRTSLQPPTEDDWRCEKIFVRLAQTGPELE